MRTWITLPLSHSIVITPLEALPENTQSRTNVGLMMFQRRY